MSIYLSLNLNRDIYRMVKYYTCIFHTLSFKVWFSHVQSVSAPILPISNSTSLVQNTVTLVVVLKCPDRVLRHNPNIFFVCLMVFNATFNNISVILWWQHFGGGINKNRWYVISKRNIYNNILYTHIQYITYHNNWHHR